MDERIKKFLWAALVSTAVAVGVRLFLIEDFRILSTSMSPSLLPGDLVFASKAHYAIRLPFSSYELIQFANPKRSDAVVLELPDSDSPTLAKRIVGIEGDRIEIKKGKLIVNGLAAQYEDVDTQSVWEIFDGKKYLTQRNNKRPDYGPIDVPQNHVFVLGDNRDESVDSRDWGPLPRSALRGRLSIVWLSLTEEGSLRSERIGKWIN